MISSNKKKVGIALIACVLILGNTLPVLADNVGGGIWDHGITVVGINKKKVYSDYFHPTKVHKSSVSIGTLHNSSGWVDPGQTSYASAIGAWSNDTHAYYDYK